LPGSIRAWRKLECVIYALKREEGGRGTPILNGARLSVYVRVADVPATVYLPKDMQQLPPGDHATMMTVELPYPLALEEGTRFALRENFKAVGAGVVTKVLG